ncbi:hypothetical protein QUF58_08670 [Anaerolineales bacterium HSG24]|nr:hypothetical protein [Anaerolineales bacterium HSG24]
MTELVPKDKTTEKLRQMIIYQIPIAHETDEAEALLTALSFQSQLYPVRHVWIDTDLGGIIGMDLEDWTYQDEWDNAVARIKVDTLADAVEIIQVWLSGANLFDWYSNVNRKYLSVKKKMGSSIETMPA